MASLKVAFLVQGEGRGHFTQALAIKEILERHGHTVCTVLCGISNYRTIPEYVSTGFDGKIIRFQSPNFSPDASNRGIRIGATVLQALVSLPVYIESLKTINKELKKQQPDLVLNFYETLAGLYKKVFGKKFRFVSIAHQFRYLHPEFKFKGIRATDQWMLKTLTRFVAMGSEFCIALSMTTHKQGAFVKILPPLLRPAIREMKTERQGHILVYILNKGYREDIRAYALRSSGRKFICFTDDPEIKEPFQEHASLMWHPLDQHAFLHYMASCDALITTAGFESIAEAAYLGKPVLAVPTHGHIEQLSNSWQIQTMGFAMRSDTFNPEGFDAFIQSYSIDTQEFRSWCDHAEGLFISLLKFNQELNPHG